MRSRPPRLAAWALLTVFLAACSNGVPGAATAPSEPGSTVVSLTFDDGNADNFAAAAVLRQNQLRATWYIPSGLVGTPGFMSWKQLLSLQSDGHEIGGHSLDHMHIEALDAASLRREVCDDRRALQEAGFNPVSFAYPFGGYDEAAKQMVRECGYSSARSIGSGRQEIPPVEAFALRAYPYIVSDTAFSKLQRYVSGTRKEGGGWLILIFHHVCDGCDYYAVSPAVFGRFIPWLREEQAQGRVQVKTVGEVILHGAR
jgi:peptidoglycan/xylan/chitin deacetylase (PgdA/CDA1 family)